MSGYIDNAFSYNEEDLGLDAETKLRFVPNKKELELFKMEKLNILLQHNLKPQMLEEHFPVGMNLKQKLHLIFQ